ncbi:MAG: T9SS type A sorting domain-containing protein [Bacteroidia bacterium]|nr:T9SS type A sorting domain-containing protein [Bacteroidia bacterium]
MKNLIILVTLFTIAFNPKSNAQAHLCDDPCPSGNLLTSKIDLCKYKILVVDSLSNTYDTLNDEFCFALINYRIRTCNGITSIIIDNYVIIEAFNSIYSNISNSYSLWDTIIIIDSSCNYCPLNLANIDLAAKDAINTLVNSIGSQTQSNYEVYFKGSCSSWTGFSFPDSSFYLGMDEGGNVDTFYVSSQDRFFQSIPCGEACCKLTYEWQTTTLANGETIQTLKVIDIDGETEQCINMPLPTPSNYSGVTKLYVFNPINGTYEQTIGDIIEQNPCKLECEILRSEIPLNSFYIKTESEKDITKIDKKIINVNSYIEIETPEVLTKINIIDIWGNKTKSIVNLNSKRIELSELKNGIYYIQYYFKNGNIISSKIQKQ